MKEVMKEKMKDKMGLGRKRTDMTDNSLENERYGDLKRRTEDSLNLF